MDRDHFQRVKEALSEALEQRGPGREKFLQDLEEQEPKVAQDARELLRVERESDEVFEASPLVLSPRLPSQIGPYRILSRLGEGAMGSVYMATMESPPQVVALKVLRVLFGTSSMARRFEYEARILARLQHPSIARIFAAGSHRDGSTEIPYFAMEYLEGATPLDQFVRTHALPLEERLRLIVTICDAVHYGHQKGIIHRDLKPDNILVTQDHAPKIIDYGIARFTAQETDWSTIHTKTGQILGTPRYMSPEQLGRDPDDVDIRADVYALGVVLYEILIDGPAFELRHRSLPEVAHLIRNTMPKRPSALAQVKVSSDIDAIVYKAMAKDREDRYSSAMALKSDLMRALENKPIEARRPSTTYQIRKLVARHKVISSFVITSALTVLSLVAVLAWKTHQLRIQRNEAVLGQEREKNLKRSAQAAREEAKHEAARAKEQARRAKQALESIVDMFRLINPMDRLSFGEHPPLSPQGPIQTTEFLRETKDRIRKHFEDDDEAKATLLSTLGNVYLGLGLEQDATAILEEALHTLQELDEPDPFELALAEIAVGNALEKGPRQDQGLIYLDTALKRLEPLDAQGVLDARARAMNSMGIIHVHRGELEQAADWLGQATQIPKHALSESIRGKLLSNLAYIYHVKGDLGSARDLYRQSLALITRQWGEDSPQSIHTWINLAICLLDEGKGKKSLMIMRRTLRIAVAELGPDHPTTGYCARVLSEYLFRQGKHDSAERLLHLGLAQYRQSPQADRTTHAYMLRGLAIMARDRGKFAQAESLLLEAIDLTQPDHPEQASLRIRLTALLGSVSLGRGDYKEAQRWLESALEQSLSTAEKSEVLLCLEQLGICLMEQERVEEGEQVLLGALRFMSSRRWERRMAPSILYHLGIAKVRGGEPEQAISLVRKAVRLSDEFAGPDSSLGYRNALASFYRSSGEFRLAKDVLMDRLRVASATRRSDDLDLVRGRGELALNHGHLEEWPDAIRNGIDALVTTPTSFTRAKAQRLEISSMLHYAFREIGDPLASEIIQRYGESPKSLDGSEPLDPIRCALLAIFAQYRQDFDQSQRFVEQGNRIPSENAIDEQILALLQARIFHDSDQNELAQTLLTQSLSELGPKEKVLRAIARFRLGEILNQQGDWIDAEAQLRQSARLSSEQFPKESTWQKLIAHALHYSKLYQPDSESLEHKLMQGANSLGQRLLPHTPRCRRVWQRMMDYYEFLDRPDEAALWQEKWDR